MKVSAWLIALLLSAVALSAGARDIVVYRWVDDSGETHFSDQPPPNVEAQRQTIRVEAGNPSSAEETASQESLFEAQQLRRQQDREAAAEGAQQAREEAEVRAENCQRARERLSTYTTARRLYEVDENGERVYLDDAELDRERALAADLVKEWCD